MTEDEELSRATSAFDRGDFRQVREITGRLTEKSLDLEVRKKARELRTKVSVDPAAIVVWVLSFLFFVAVAASYLGDR